MDYKLWPVYLGLVTFSGLGIILGHFLNEMAPVKLLKRFILVLLVAASVTMTPVPFIVTILALCFSFVILGVLYGLENYFAKKRQKDKENMDTTTVIEDITQDDLKVSINNNS